MNTKLTLTIQDEVIRKAKAYAKKKNRSLSDIIENYLKSITAENSTEEKPKTSPVVKSLKGAFKLPADFDYKKELAKAIQSKHE
jgi:predicted CopG family antitoxin